MNSIQWKTIENHPELRYGIVEKKKNEIVFYRDKKNKIIDKEIHQKIKEYQERENLTITLTTAAKEAWESPIWLFQTPYSISIAILNLTLYFLLLKKIPVPWGTCFAIGAMLLGALMGALMAKGHSWGTDIFPIKKRVVIYKYMIINFLLAFFPFIIWHLVLFH